VLTGDRDGASSEVLEIVVIETVERHACLGVDLVDALTGGPVVGGSRVVAVGQDADAIRANRSRWFFETALAPSTDLSIVADYYVPETRAVTVPPPTEPGALVEVRLLPRTGYPFGLGVTRVVGSVVFDIGGAPAIGAIATVQPLHTGSGTEPAVVTRTTDDGQYVMWFAPLNGATPPLADAYSVSVQIDVGGTMFAGALPAAPLAANRVNHAPVVRLEEVP
jgi:hypothetical protein